ncbi:hypothetical protein J31TS6_27670 [Brevibacillus reuszeri]|nr:hypothetical protein J31TS6_27670 [Brevibacillus reuszeri]
MTDQLLVFRFNREDRLNMLFRDHEYVYGSNRIDIVKGDHVLVLINFVGGEFPVYDFAKNAVHLKSTSFPI